MAWEINQKMDKLKVVDAMKGISAVGIVIYHYTHFGTFEYPFYNILRLVYTYGYFLVDLFFILSGFLFFKSYAHKISAKELSFRTFMMRRYIRLFPLFLLTTGIVAVEQWILLYHAGYTFMHGADLYSLVLNILGLQHVGLADAVAFNGPAWQISILLVCYGAYFFICKYNFSGGGIFLICLALYRCNFQVPMLNQQVFRGMLGFTMGWLCYAVWQKVNRIYIRNITAAEIVFTVVLWVVFRHRQIDIFGDKILYFILVFWPAFFLFCMTSRIISALFSNSLFMLLGKISYSLYLWHFPIEILIFSFGLFTGCQLDYAKPGIWAVRLVVSILMAAGSCYWIEPYLNKLVDKKAVPFLKDMFERER